MVNKDVYINARPLIQMR